MPTRLRQVMHLPFHAWLFGIFPILYLYAVNRGLVFDHEVIPTMLFMLAATTAVFLAINAFTSNSFKSAAIVSVQSLCFSLSGHIHDLVLDNVSLAIWTILVLVAGAGAAIKLRRLKSPSALFRVTLPLNLIALLLTLVQLVNILAGHISESIKYQNVSEGRVSARSTDATPKVNDSRLYPDIYYIIPDGYPSDRWLQETMNYDNSDFTRALESRGFVVPRHAQSNYGATLLSIPSVLNMQFYNSNESSFKDLDYLRLSIADNAVARQLQQWGYTFVQLMSGYLFPSPIADINRDFTASGPMDIEVNQENLSAAITGDSEGTERHFVDFGQFYKQSFVSLYVDTTLLRIVASDIEALVPRDESGPYGLFAQDRFLGTIDEIESIVGMKEATFTIVHLIKPHGPTTFDAKGNVIEENTNPSHEEYFAEFGFTNTKFLQLIDAILEGSQHQPVIVFQADHGSTYGDVGAKDGRLTHFDTYAAYFLPESFSVRFPHPFTLINTFPTVFNEVFGTDYDLQDNILFDLPRGYDAPFEQVDVTDAFLRG